MPYIKNEDIWDWDAVDKGLSNQKQSYPARDVFKPTFICPPNEPGQLNYAITCVLKDYIEMNDLNYQTINDIVGALEGAKLEFYRRVAAPYEDTKIKENGDVY
jgi:hypothetical protein